MYTYIYTYAGEVTDLHMPLNEEGQSRGIAFITFATKDRVSSNVRVNDDAHDISNSNNSRIGNSNSNNSNTSNDNDTDDNLLRHQGPRKSRASPPASLIVITIIIVISYYHY